MTSHLICPHCRRSIDSQNLDTAVSTEAHYLICPECDGPIVLFFHHDAVDEALPPPAAKPRQTRTWLERNPPA